ncbi:MAG TPA: hypothetical protein VN947_18165 [Polyangia bacterium]|nr:hypothetical protein [Polyangia bacterium]
MVRVFTLCLSLALIVLGVAGVMHGAPLWLVALDFAVGGIGIVLDAILLATQGRWSVIVAFAMSVGLVILFFAGIVGGAAPWFAWSIFAVGALFFAVGCARAFSASMYAGDNL